MYTRATNFIWAILDRLQLFVLVVIASNSSTIGSFVPPLPKCAGPNVGNQWTKPIQIPFDSSDLTSLYSYFTCQSKLTDILAKFMSLWCSWIKHAIPLLKGSAIKPGLYSQSISVRFITSCGCLWFTQLMWNPFCDISAYVSTALVTIYWSHCYVPLVFEITYLDVGAKIICVWDFLQMFQTMKKKVFTYLGTQFHFNSWAKHCFSLLE